MSKKNSLKVFLFGYLSASANIAYILLKNVGNTHYQKKHFQKTDVDLRKLSVEKHLSFFILQCGRVVKCPMTVIEMFLF